MKFITFLKKQMALTFGVGVLLSFSSCGSFQYSGIYDDGIYSESVPAQPANETVDNSSNSSEYYKNYFKEKSLQIEDDNTVFTDVDSYGGTYADDSENTNNYAGWGENNSSDIVVNVYDNGPFYGNGWGFNYRNIWGWNLGWNNWGFGFWQPNYYNPWNSPWNNPWYNPFCYYGSYNNYGYFNNGYNRYRGRSYAYINGGRSRSRYGNSRSLSSRSVLNATTRSRANTRSSSRPSTRSRATTTRPNSRSTTRSRSNSITRPTTTRSSNNSTRSNSTYRSTRSTTRSSSPSRSTTRSSSPSRSRRSSGGSSSRRRNN